MNSRPLGLLFIALGLAAVVVGLLVGSGALAWFGRLPGDIRIVRPGVQVFFPLTSMILVSVVLSLVLYLVRRFF
jgi:hypothetical protein